MKQTNHLLGWGVIFLSLMVFGCAKESDNVVTASDGVEIRFDRQGSGSPTLVFVHGWANDRTVWEAQVAHFSEKYEVINIDLPSFGVSGNNRQHFTIASFGEDVATAIKKLNLEQVVLIGFSMGTPVVIDTANRVPGLTIGVVSIDSLSDVEAKTPQSEISDVVNWYMELVANPTNEILVSSGFYKKNTETSFQRVRAMLQDAPRIGWRESLQDSVRWHNEDCIDLISRLQVPIIAINSETRPIEVETLRKYAPSFQARVIPDTGHVVMWDAPEEFNRLLEESIQELQGQSE